MTLLTVRCVLTRAASIARSAVPAVVYFIGSLLASALAFQFLVAPDHRRIGDYYFEGDPAIRHGLDGGVFTMFGVDPTPLMWPFSLILRLPFVALGRLTDTAAWIGGQTDVTIAVRDGDYTYGALACMAVAGAAVGAACWSHASRPGRWRFVFPTAAVAVFLFNPISVEAISWGHPEEVLMGGFIAAGLITLAAGRSVLGACLVAAAVATKQPAILIVPVAFFMIPVGQRRKSTLAGLATLLALTVPWVIASIGDFFEQNRWATGIVQDSQKPENLWSVIGPRADWFALHSHWIIALVTLAASLAVAWRHSWRIPPLSGISAIAAILVARAFLDAVNITYYLVPAIAAFLAFEAMLTPRRLRWAPLGTAVLAWALVSLTEGRLSEFIEGIGSYNVQSWLALCAMLSVVLFALALRRDLRAPLPFVPQVDKENDEKARYRATMRKRRAALYGLLAVVAIVFLFAVQIGAQREDLVEASLPAGYDAVSREYLESKYPGDVYWLGADPYPGQKDLRFGLLKPEFTSRADYAIVSYRYGGQGLVTVISQRGTGDQVRAFMKACRDGRTTGRFRCREGWEEIPTGLGPGLKMNDQKELGFWSVVVPVGSGSVTLSSTDGPPRDRLLPELRLMDKAR